MAPQDKSRSKLAILLNMARPHRRLILTGGGLASFSAVLSLTPVIVAAYAASAITPGGAGTDLLFLAAIAFAAMALRWFLMAGAFACSHIAAYRLLYDLRIAIADKLVRMPLGDVTDRQSGAIRKILQEDVERIELFVAHILIDAFGAATLPIASLALLLLIDPLMALAAVSTLPLAILFQLGMYRNVDEHMRRYAEATEAMNAAFVEFVNAIPVIKVFNVQTRSLAALTRSIESYRRLLLDISRQVVPYWSGFKLMMRSTIVVVAAVGAIRFLNGRLSLSEFVLCLMVGAGILQPVMRLLFAGSLLRTIEHGSLRIREILEAPELPQPVSSQTPSDSSVEFDHVDFSYGATPALLDVSFRLAAGTAVAVVGPSGAGKSTVARLIARFWDPAAGSVRIGGVDLRDVGAEALGAWASFVFQDVFLFDESALENVRLGRPDATREMVIAAAKAAGAHDFICALPQGYDTFLGERGARLSGGERQRLSIARALLRDAPVLVLDEVTAYADATTEAALVRSIAGLKKGRTLIVITHRPALLAQADEVLLFDQGRLVGRGDHAALLVRHDLYRRLFQRADSPALVLE